MSVRAKFKVYSVTKRQDAWDVNLQAVSSGSKENESFWRWTPAGEIRLSTINPGAVEQFEPGAEFYIDFTKALPAPPKES